MNPGFFPAVVVSVLLWPTLLFAQDLTPEQTFQNNSAAEVRIRERAKHIQIQVLQREAIAQFNEKNGTANVSMSTSFDKPLSQDDLWNQPVSGSKTYLEIRGEACEITLRLYDRFRESKCPLPDLNWTIGCSGATAPYPNGDSLERLNREGRLVEISGVCADPKKPGARRDMYPGDSSGQDAIEYSDLETQVKPFLRSHSE